MADPTFDAALRSFAAERKYGDATLQRWLQLAAGDAAALLALAQALRPSENQLRDLWEWAEEIAARDRVPLAQVLAAEPIAAARRRRVGRNDKIKLIKGELRRLRFPQLAATEERLAALVRELGLPRNVRLTLPEFLEGDDIRIEITANSRAALRDAAARLLAAAQTPGCAALFALLGEAP